MYAIYNHYDSKFNALGDITWRQNKLIYANKHGYAAHLFTEDNYTGFRKIHQAKELLTEHPEYEWLWWTGTDSLITNMNTRIEDRVMNQYHFIVATDVNGINADSFLIRNSPEGHALLDDLLSLEEECSKFWDAEQRGIAVMLGLPVTADPSWLPPGDVEVCDKYKGIVKIVPQRYMNAYNYSIYREYADHRDKTGVNGNWNYGDWLIHWPGTPLEMRLELARHYLPFVVR
jgi:hypothetical protein